MIEALSLLDLSQKAKELSGDYENNVIAEINDHVVRMSRMTGPYFWHLHPDSDEVFLSLEGGLIIELKDRRVELSTGQMFTVSRNTEHRTSPTGAVSINLTFERADITTARVDDPTQSDQ